jgi:hypothetical protein
MASPRKCPRQRKKRTFADRCRRITCFGYEARLAPVQKPAKDRGWLPMAFATAFTLPLIVPMMGGFFGAEWRLPGKAMPWSMRTTTRNSASQIGRDPEPGAAIAVHRV